MKILIAYDGSESSDAGIDGLRRAGLPAEGVEALVVSVAEVWLPPPPRDEVLDDTFPLQIPAGVKRMRERAERLVGEAGEMAAGGAERVRGIFPRWAVSHEALDGSPAFELLHRAGQWRPRLVVGSQGRTALGRFVLGSVSQKILTEAQTSVRVSRRPTGTGASAERILLAVDGSPGALAAAKAVAARAWTPGSEVRVVVADDLLRAGAVGSLLPSAGEFVKEVNEAEPTRADELAAEAVETLRESLGDQNVTVSSAVEVGDPKRVLVRHAEEFGADCIFTGAIGFSNRVERFLLGSVSAAVAARAHCSVEVVRADNPDDTQ